MFSKKLGEVFNSNTICRSCRHHVYNAPSGEWVCLVCCRCDRWCSNYAKSDPLQLSLPL